MKAGRWMAAVTMAAGLMWTSGAQAGDLTPPGAPGSTMHTLEEIYQRLAVLESKQTAIEGKLASAGLQQTCGNMVLIPAGDFVMGALTNLGHEGYADEIPQHTVYVGAFYMDRYEVTSNLWAEVYTWATSKGYAFANSGLGKEGDHPVHTVNWYDAIAWCNARSQRDGFTPCYTNTDGTVYTDAASGSFAGGCDWAASGYRLPTEAEWEKAARGGVANRRFPWNDVNTIQHARGNYNAFASYSYDTSPTRNYHPSYDTGDVPYTSPVGSFSPNGYGLYDMAGNVSEWCWDWYQNNYYASSPASDPRGPAVTLSFRVLRGGGWYADAAHSRCAYRYYLYPDNAWSYSGFRCARGL